MNDQEYNRAVTIENLADILRWHFAEKMSFQQIATELVDSGYVKPEKASRVWMYGKGEWSGPWVSLGGDEYCNRPLVIRLPGERALLLNLAPRLKKRYCNGSCHEETQR